MPTSASRVLGLKSCATLLLYFTFLQLYLFTLCVLAGQLDDNDDNYDDGDVDDNGDGGGGDDDEEEEEE